MRLRNYMAVSKVSFQPSQRHADEAKKRKYEREIIDEFLRREENQTQAGLNRKLHKEERKTLRKFAEDLIAEGINPITNKKLID